MTNKEAIRRILDHKRVHSLNEPRAILINEALDLAIQALERPQDKWIDHSEEGYVECPICNCLTNCDDNIDELHYCWNCGAQMIKPKPEPRDEWQEEAYREAMRLDEADGTLKGRGHA